MQITVRSDLKEVFSRVQLEHQRQIPFAIAKGLTLTAQQVRAAERTEMERVFDRPTPFTLGALYVKPATKANLVATVWIKDQFFYNGRSSSHLHPHIFGEQREVKRAEKLFREKGLLPANLYLVPGSAAQLDRFGNMSRGQMQKVIAALRAFRDQYQNRPAKGSPTPIRGKRRRAEEYFVGRPGGAGSKGRGNGSLPLGVWQRFTFSLGSAVRPVLIFVRTPSYRVRFRFFDIAKSVIDANLKRNVEQALREAIATAR